MIKQFYWTHKGDPNRHYSGPVSNGNESVLHITQSFRIGTSSLDVLVDTSWRGSYPFVEMQLALFYSSSQLDLLFCRETIIKLHVGLI